jgi:hypothetical protein
MDFLLGMKRTAIITGIACGIKEPIAAAADLPVAAAIGEE